MKGLFSWLLFKNNKEIEKYQNLTYNLKEKTFVINENLFLIYQTKKKVLVKKTPEYEITIDFLKKEIVIEFLEYNKKSVINLSLVDLKENKDYIEITYNIEDEEELTKLIIKKKVEKL